ncbi:MAG: AMP-binding protein [Candidatus Hydrogenedentes bacterium]|nr:AMP-binding protein [Candidatus Hydrogenedentota bacterium]
MKTATRIWESVEHWAAEKPQAEALVFNEVRLSWEDFQVEIDRVAKLLLEAGVGKGDAVAMVAMGCPEFLITFLATAKAGAVWLGLSPKFTLDELRYVLGHSQPKVLFTLHSYLGMDLVERGKTFKQEFPCIREVIVLGDAAEGTREYEAFTRQDRSHLDIALAERAATVQPDDEVLLMYTSGSTGKPKGVLHTHAGIIRNIEVEVKHLGWNEDTRVLLHFPINHVAADVEIGYGAVQAGAAAIFMDRFDPQASLEVIERERVTVMGQVPVMYLMQFQTPKFKTMDWSKIKSFIWSGSTAPQVLLDVLSGIAARTGASLITGYGSTELCGFVTYSMPGDDLELLAKSAGKVVPPFAMKIVDAKRQEVPFGEVGEIAVSGPSLMKGYLKNPAATAAVLEGGWYYTSDLGWMNKEGYLFISGRKSEMFKTGGENVFPREIEEVLEAHPGVIFAAVIGVPDAMYNEVGKAFIMIKPGQTLDGEMLRDHCKTRLANFKVPKSFELRKELPLLPNGKVNKMALRKELGLG